VTTCLLISSRFRFPVATVIGLLGIWVLGPMAGDACIAADSGRVITPDYSNSFFDKAKMAVPHLKIVLVEDQRGGDHRALGTTVSTTGDNRVPLSLSEPLSDFVRRGFNMMLGGAETTAKPVEVEVIIQKFEANFEKAFLEKPKCLLLARVELRIPSDSGAVTLGWLENLQQRQASSGVLDCQEVSIYLAVAAFAQALQQERLPLSEVAARIRAGTPVNWEPITVRVEYREPWLIGAEFPWGSRAVYQVFEASDMKDSYDHMFCTMAEGVGWLKGRAGFRLEVGFLSRSGLPRPKNPKWNIEKSELSMFAIPIHGTFLYRLRSGETPHLLSPYVGLGGGVYVGLENLEAKADYGGSEFEGHSRAIRASGAVHALIGVEVVRIVGPVSGVAEIRWTQAGDGSTTDFVPDDEREEYNDTLFDTVRRSSFNFTGWSVEMGVRVYRGW
jgi:hypothetical protein